jgi:hypothetical protein
VVLLFAAAGLQGATSRLPLAAAAAPAPAATAAKLAGCSEVKWPNAHRCVRFGCSEEGSPRRHQPPFHFLCHPLAQAHALHLPRHARAARCSPRARGEEAAAVTATGGCRWFCVLLFAAAGLQGAPSRLPLAAAASPAPAATAATLAGTLCTYPCNNTTHLCLH